MIFFFLFVYFFRKVQWEKLSDVGNSLQIFHHSAPIFQSFSYWKFNAICLLLCFSMEEEPHANELCNRQHSFHTVARGNDRNELCFCYDIHFLCGVDFRLVHSHLSGTSDSSRTKSATYSSYCKQTHNFYCNLKTLHCNG